MSAVAILYVVTGVVSLVIGFLLVRMAMTSGQGRIQTVRKPVKEEYVSREFKAGGMLRDVVYGEINEVVGSREKSQMLSQKITEIVDKEIEKKVQQTQEELARKFQSTVEQKGQSEEVAWKKYNKVLGDKRKTEAVLRSIAEGLVVVDAKGKVIMMNPAAEKLLGVSRKDKIGKSIDANLKEGQLLSLAKGSSEHEDREIELLSGQDETKKILRASSAVVEDENGHTVGMVSVLSDITKQKELDNMKSNFVASVSHELRTPLVAIDKSISLILGKTTGEISETQEQFLGIAQRNLKRLGLLINDLLDLSKLEAGKLELRREPTSIAKVISESVDSLNNWAGTKSITLEKQVAAGIADVNIDPNRIIQILTNLIGNAIKFTPNGGKVTVGAVLKKENNEIEVNVTDTGIGMTKEDLAKVFDKFYQVGERAPTDISGTGIGLCISKEIVTLHGGKIWVESEKDHGAKFTFTLPL